MAALEVVPIAKPDPDGILCLLDKLKTRVTAGEFDHVMIAAFRPDGTLITAERGKTRGKLFKLGLLDCLKYDILAAMDSQPNEPTGF